ncbi:RNA 2'-phosphotransferase, Tpt1 / KptA family [Paenibacillus sp. 1_12]|nr:RNA 2'-phosphotransferase, Tpt1 / KptA family [Paenibacillus sp. 1_12]
MESRWSFIEDKDIRQVVKNCAKQRFEIINDYIRANYGHSVGRLEYQGAIPSDVLYHGTNAKVVDIILAEGIKPMGRKYIHFIKVPINCGLIRV